MAPEKCRVRFAPSPTGFLHIGSVRTALFNWIFARGCNGKFLLRIEDTDRERSSKEYKDSILNSLRWLGLDWDEDVYIQSHNVDNHREAVQKLLNNGSAYKCFCSPEVLEKKRRKAQAKKISLQYDGTCRDITAEECTAFEKADRLFAVRCKIPAGETVFYDVVHGEMVYQNTEIDDFIILRRDNTPTYQLAVVADDHAMEITHVIRGDDHLTNTPKQVILYNALGWHVPVFVHIPMILGPDKTRLSKRHGAASAEIYRERGYLSEAVRNFLLLLGWYPGEDREIIALDKVVQEFRLEDIARNSAVFDEQKLMWMNGQYIARLSESELAELLKPFIAQDKGLDNLVKETGEEYLLSVLTLLKPRIKLLPEFISLGGYFYRDPVVYEPAAVKKHWKEFEVMERLARVRLTIIECENYTIGGIESAVRKLAEKLNLAAAKLIHPTRLALTGFGASPGLFEVMHILGKETVIRRLEKAIYYLNTL